MRTVSRGVGCGLAATVLSGCALLAPPLLAPNPVDATPFVGLSDRVGPSVGRLLSTSCGGAPMAGSGFVVDEHHVLTASHVVGGARQVSLRLTGAQPVLADVVGIDPATDTALIRTADPLPGRPLVLAGADETRPGTQVEVLGYPLGEAELGTSLSSITTVSESAVVNDHPAQGLIIVDATLRVGMSGGPVVDAAGRVRGMVVASIGGRGGRDSANPVAVVLPTGLLANSVHGWRDGSAAAPERCEGEAADASASPVELVVGDGVDVELAHTLWLLGSSIRSGQFSSAWGMLTSRQQSLEGDLTAWTARAGALPLTRLEIIASGRTGERATARARLLTAWPDGGCRTQTVNYGFRLVQGIWLIDAIDTGTAARCTP